MRRSLLVIVGLVLLVAIALGLRAWLLDEVEVSASPSAMEPTGGAGLPPVEPPPVRAVVSQAPLPTVDAGVVSFAVEVEVFDGAAHAPGVSVRLSGEVGVLVQSTNAMGFTRFELAPGTWLVEEPAVSPRRTLEVLGPMQVRLDLAHLKRVSGRVSGRGGQSAEVQVTEGTSARVVKSEGGTFALTTDRDELELRAHSGSQWSDPVRVKAPAEGVELTLAPMGLVVVATVPPISGVITVVHDGVTVVDAPFTSGGKVRVPTGSVEITVKGGGGGHLWRGETSAAVRGLKAVRVELTLEPVTP
jgi:hypothetical protein